MAALEAICVSLNHGRLLTMFCGKGLRKCINRNFLKSVQYSTLGNATVEELVPVTNETRRTSEKATKISKAMQVYLQRAKEHDDFMKKEMHEFEVGKRHLANMMGVDPDNFTQEDIDKAIEYLLPSGLFEPRARPVLKPPQQLFPKRKAAEFDASGRPFHCFFYTSHPNYNQALHDIAVKLDTLNKHEDHLISKGIKTADPHETVNLDGTDWLEKEEMESLFLETLRDEDHSYLLACLNRLSAHAYSKRETEFILKFRKKLVAATSAMEIPQLMFDESGRPFMEALGVRKRSSARVVVRGRGNGKLEINGHDISFFDSDQSRRQIMFPLQFTGLLDTVDVEATVIGQGFSAEAGAIRYALSLALRSFVSKDMVEKMRLAGLLTYDLRTRERKKPGQEGARRKYTWKKR